MKRWNTQRIALHASLYGAAWAALMHIGQWGLAGDEIAAGTGFVFGGAMGGAMLAAAVAGVRNLLVARR
jgi:hypothetical protein